MAQPKDQQNNPSSAVDALHNEHERTPRFIDNLSKRPGDCAPNTSFETKWAFNAAETKRIDINDVECDAFALYKERMNMWRDNFTGTLTKRAIIDAHGRSTEMAVRFFNDQVGSDAAAAGYRESLTARIQATIDCLPSTVDDKEDEPTDESIEVTRDAVATMEHSLPLARFRHGKDTNAAIKETREMWEAAREDALSYQVVYNLKCGQWREAKNQISQMGQKIEDLEQELKNRAKDKFVRDTKSQKVVLPDAQKEKLKEIKNKFAEAGKKIADLDEENRRLNEMSEGLKIQLAQMQRECSDLHNKNGSLASDFATKAEHADALSEENKKLQRALQTLVTLHNEMKKEHDGYDRLVESRKRIHSQMESIVGDIKMPRFETTTEKEEDTGTQAREGHAGEGGGATAKRVEREKP